MAENFENATIKSFVAVRTDVDELKSSMNDWVVFLDGSLRDARMRILALEKKIEQLEAGNGKNGWN